MIAKIKTKKKKTVKLREQLKYDSNQSFFNMHFKSNLI